MCPFLQTNKNHLVWNKWEATCVDIQKWYSSSSRASREKGIVHEWGRVHTTPAKFENAALFLRLGLPSTLTRHENGAFRKRSLKRRNLKSMAFRFIVDWKHLKNGAFRKRWHHANHMISMTGRVFLKYKSKMTSDCCVFQFLRSNVDKAWTSGGKIGAVWSLFSQRTCKLTKKIDYLQSTFHLSFSLRFFWLKDLRSGHLKCT